MLSKLVSRVLLVSVLTGTAAMAQSKIAVINTQKAMLETAELKKAQADMEAKFKPRQLKMEALQKEIAQIQQQLQSLGDKLSPQGQADLNIQGNRKQKEFERLREDLQAEVDSSRQEILQRASQRMQEVVNKLAEEKGIDLVLDEANTVFRKVTLDLTKDATAAYDKAYPSK